MAIQKSSKINMYRFVNINDDSSGGADPVAKSINTQTQAINNMGKTINGIAQTVVNLKNLALLQYKEDQKKLREKFKPKYTKQVVEWSSQKYR